MNMFNAALSDSSLGKYDEINIIKVHILRIRLLHDRFLLDEK